MDAVVARSLVESAAGAAGQIATWHAVQLRAVATLATGLDETTPPLPDGDEGADEPEWLTGVDAAAAELAARLVVPIGSAYRLVRLALALTTRLPLTFAALAEGRIDQARATAVADQTEQMSDAGAALVEEEVAVDLPALTTGQLKERLKAEVATIDPDAVRRRARKATADRRGRLRDLGDGIAELSLVGPATDLVPAWEKLGAVARDRERPGATVDPHASFVHDGRAPTTADGAPVDRRGIDARRFDAGVELLRQPLAGAGGVGDGCGPQLMITLAAALGLDDEPAQLAGFGSLPAEMARTLLADHRFRRIVTDPITGHLVAVDGHTHPPGWLPDLSATRRSGTSTDVTDDADQQEQVEVPLEPRDPLDHRAPDDPDADDQGPTAGCHGGGGGPRRPGPSGGGRGTGGGGQRRTDPASAVPPVPVLTPVGADSRERADARLAPWPARDAPAAHGTPPAAQHQEQQVPGQQVPEQDVPERPAQGSSRPTRFRSCPVASAGGGPYDIVAALHRFVRARSKRCTAPGCRTPSRRCDTDHRIPWPKGPTCPCNLAPLCRRHHLAKHRFGWAVRKASPDPADPSQHWTSPLGYEYLVPAEPLLPRTRAWRLARERGTDLDTWPSARVDPLRPYPRIDVHGRSAERALAAIAAERAARSRSPGWAGYDGDPPF